MRPKGAEFNLEKYPACWKQYENGVCVFNPWALVDAVVDQDVDRVNTLKQFSIHDIKIKDIDGYTALHKEAQAGNLEAVKLLVEAGVDVNSVEN